MTKSLRQFWCYLRGYHWLGKLPATIGDNGSVIYPDVKRCPNCGKELNRADRIKVQYTWTTEDEE